MSKELYNLNNIVFKLYYLKSHLIIVLYKLKYFIVIIFFLEFGQHRCIRNDAERQSEQMPVTHFV